MDSAIYSRYGKIIFAVAMIAIGGVHIVTRNFPTGLEPVPLDVPSRQVLVYVVGLGLITAGILLFWQKLGKHACAVAGVIWLMLLGYVQIPMILANPHSAAGWTVTAETLGILSGVFLIADGYAKRPGIFKITARFFLVAALGILCYQHYLYLAFIETLVPAWLPFHLFWAWLVAGAFLLAAISLLVGLKVRIAALCLAAMFLIWAVILHLPRAIGSTYIEAEWTSTFVALAWGGVSLLVAGSVKD